MSGLIGCRRRLDRRGGLCRAWRVSVVRLPLEEVVGRIAGIRTAGRKNCNPHCGATRSPGATLPFLAVQVLPKSPLIKAIRYASNNWKALNVYTTDSRLTIDNNMRERTVRMIAIGRKNCVFIGSEAAGYRMAVLYSIIASAKRHHLEPFACVRDLLLQLRSLCCSHAGTATAASPPAVQTFPSSSAAARSVISSDQ